MKISYNWLKELTNTNLSPEEIDVILTDTGLEVEGLEKIEVIKGGLEGVIVAEVLECEKHPDADKLKVTKVSTGTEVLQVVCGAPNVAKGQKVILATPGTTLYPNPDEAFKIKPSKIRGVESNGMLCAEDELGLGKSHDGILVLPEKTPVGMKASAYFQLESDTQIEIGLTPNRADAMGIYGVARDLKAYLNVHKNQNITLQPIQKSTIIAQNSTKNIAIQVDNAAACPRYLGVTLIGVKVEASPVWLQNRLRAIGLSPINNIVDCTNYVMRELGTPLHAFDADKVGEKIVVKNANEGAVFKTLDGVERTLSSSDLMITNGNDYLAIAGVFGGLESGVSDKTTSIFIESAYFDAVSIRKIAKRHALNTDASFRYERGVDPELTKIALERVVYLIQQVAGGEIAMELKEVSNLNLTPKIIDFTFAKCQQIIGTPIPKETIKLIFENLDIQITSENEQGFTIQVPHYRVDVTREIDVIEEVLRIYGFNNIPLPEKLNSNLSYSNKPNRAAIQAQISEFFVGQGFSEMMNNSLTTSTYSSKFMQPELDVTLLNPLSNELDVMRQTLLFGVLETIERNQNRQQANTKLFEFGRVYQKKAEKYVEGNRLIVALTGRLQEESWNSTKRSASFYSIKGITEALFQRLGLTTYIKESAIENSILADGIDISILRNKVGQIGWISKKMKKQFGIKQDVFVADLDWDTIVSSLNMVKNIYKPLPKTFENRRDFSLLLNEDIAFNQIVETAQKIDKKILKDIRLFDVYEGDKLEVGKKSYAVAFYFQDAENTLKDEQIDRVMDKIRENLESELKATLR
jgi:phenylalanyl-tRNA synthetase beta chain